MRILLVGANGFVGRNLREYFSQKQDEVALECASRTELDILNENSLYKKLKEQRYDVIINAALYNPRVGTGKQPEKELENDLRMFYNFEKYSELYGKMIYFGSGAEYNKAFPICSVNENEWQHEIPDAPYAFAKYLINRQIEKSSNIYNLRIFGLFGKYENWSKTFISGACCKALKNLPITIRQDVLFDYLYIDDFCEMLYRFLCIEKPLYHSYNITSGRKIALTELASIVKRVSGKSVPIIICQDGMGNEYTSDNRRLLAEIGDMKLTAYDKAILKLYEWYREREKEIDMLSLLY